MDHLLIGKIVNVHGIKGEVKVLPFSGNPEAFRDYKNILLRHNGEVNEYQIAGVKIIKNTAILRLIGVIDIDSANALRGYEILIEKTETPELPEDTFYIFDLKGCKVFEGEELLGILKDVISTGSNDVYVIKREEKSDLLVPALKSVINKVDKINKEIKVTLPEGLREIYE